MSKGMTKLPYLQLDVDHILTRADGTGEALTMQSSLSGVGFATNGDSLLLLQGNGFIGAPLAEWRVMYQELGYMIEEAERWARERRH
jgi:hypothetical protein